MLNRRLFCLCRSLRGWSCVSSDARWLTSCQRSSCARSSFQHAPGGTPLTHAVNRTLSLRFSSVGCIHLHFSSARNHQFHRDAHRLLRLIVAMGPTQGCGQSINSCPDDLSTSLPANTGYEDEFCPQQRRNAAIQSGVVFSLGRRLALSLMPKRVPTWSYLDPYLHDLAYWGSNHTADLEAQFGLREPSRFAATNQDDAFVHFVNFHKPNGGEGRKAWWPQLEASTCTRPMVSRQTTIVGNQAFEGWKKYVFVF